MNLFTPAIDEIQWHPHFKTLMGPDSRYICDVLNDWAKGFVDRDGKFVAEFQRSFNTCFWELYVHAVLKKYGLPIDFSVNRPDFLIREPEFNIEAAVALHARGAVPEHDQTLAIPDDLNEFNRVAILRLSNTIAAKRVKFREEYASLEHVRDKPFVLAVSNFEQRHSHLGAQRPIEAVLLGRYVDEERYLKQGRPGGVLPDDPMEKISKREGMDINLGLFCRPECPEISAVLFNNCANFGKVLALSSDPEQRSVFTALRFNPKSDIPHIIHAPAGQYAESLIDGLRIYHNPFARFPLNPAVFRHPKVFQTYIEDGEVVVEQHEGLLLTRTTLTVMNEA